jgi:hypothetical protein
VRGEKCAKSASASPKKLRVNPSSVRRLINPPWLRLRRASAERVEDLVFILGELEFYVDMFVEEES